MRSLAKALGCSATTPYRYFENKEAILAAVRASILERVCDMLEAVGRDQPDSVAWARAHTQAFVDFAFDEPHAYRLVYDLYQAENAQSPELLRANARSDRVMREYVEQLVAEGHLEGDPAELAYLYFATVHGLIGFRMTGRPFGTRDAFDKKLRHCLRLMTQGVRGPNYKPHADAGVAAVKAKRKAPKSELKQPHADLETSGAKPSARATSKHLNQSGA